jgi:hypothetical protein
VPRRLSLFAAVAATSAIVAIGIAPASLVDVRVADLTNGLVRLDDADGTVWNGRGVVIARSSYVPVTWRVDPWALVRGELRVRIAAGAHTPAPAFRGAVTLARGSFALQGAEATFPAALALAAAGPVASASVSGDIDLAAPELRWDPPANRGEALVRWKAARLSVPGRSATIDLGDVSATLTAAGDRIAGPVSNSGGDLAIRGEVALAADRSLTFSLQLTPRGIASDGLGPALAALGTREGDGWRIDGTLSLR